MQARLGAVAAALAVVLCACGGDGEDGDAARSGPPAAASGPAAAASASASATSARQVETTTAAISKTFWYGGFRVGLTSATLQNGKDMAGSTKPVVALAANFENLGPQTLRFGGDLVLRSAGRNYFATGEGHDVPALPGGANQDGTAVIVVDPQFRLDDAELVVGSSDKNQARVPLGRTGTLTSLEPVAVPMTMRLSTVPFTVAVRGGELRADEPRFYRQLATGTRMLKVSFTASSAGCPLISYRLSLALPDGTTVDPSESGEALALENFMSFVLTEPVAGAYVLRLQGSAQGSTSPKCPPSFSAQAPFTIG